MCRVRDPWIQTHRHDVTEDEMTRRMLQPKYRENLAIAAQTLDAEMRNRG